MRARDITLILFLALTLTASAYATNTPTADEIIKGMIDAAGGEAAFQQLALLQLDLNEEEVTSDGKVHQNSAKALVSTTELNTFRLEQGSLVLARYGDSAWATMGGNLDKRPQTPAMAKGTLHNRLIPILFPFCLATDNVSVTKVSSGTFHGTPAWRLTVTFGASYFASPIMNTAWSVYVAKDSSAFLAASFQPPPEYAEATDEGVRYSYLKTQVVDGVRLPSQMLLEGLFRNGLENGHTRTVKIIAEARDWDASLFLNPEQLKALEEQEHDGDLPY